MFDEGVVYSGANKGAGLLFAGSLTQAELEEIAQGGPRGKWKACSSVHVCMCTFYIIIIIPHFDALNVSFLCEWLQHGPPAPARQNIPSWTTGCTSSLLRIDGVGSIEGLLSWEYGAGQYHSKHSPLDPSRGFWMLPAGLFPPLTVFLLHI